MRTHQTPSESEDSCSIFDGHGELSRLLFDNAPIGLALVDGDLRFVMTNAAFVATANVACGSDNVARDLPVDEDRAFFIEAIRQCMARGEDIDELRVRLKRAPEDPAFVKIRAIRYGASENWALLALMDNREQLRLERQITQATKMQAVGQLAGGVAHDFNNILTAILGHCELLLSRGALDEKDIGDIDQIRQNADRAANLVRQLLAFSRQQTMRPRLLCINDVLDEVSHLLKHLLGEKIALTVRCDPDLGLVRVDPGQLEQVIVNLAVNARDAMNGAGQLAIETRNVTAAQVRALGHDVMPIVDYVAIIVTDSGSGIPEHIIGKIFEPFFTTKDIGKGTGLGLSTVYGVVKQTDGFIFALNAPASGACFTIYFPRIAGARSVPVAAHPAPIEAKAEHGRILLVEDEEAVREVVAHALEHQGYDVVTAQDGHDALDKIASDSIKIDLLISDVVMPNIDGPTLLQKVRRTHPDMPVLFISGYAEQELRRLIGDAGVSFLAKPFSIRALNEAVHLVMKADGV